MDDDRASCTEYRLKLHRHCHDDHDFAPVNDDQSEDYSFRCTAVCEVSQFQTAV